MVWHLQYNWAKIEINLDRKKDWIEWILCCNQYWLLVSNTKWKFLNSGYNCLVVRFIVCIFRLIIFMWSARWYLSLSIISCTNAFHVYNTTCQTKISTHDGDTYNQQTSKICYCCNQPIQTKCHPVLHRNVF